MLFNGSSLPSPHFVWNHLLTLFSCGGVSNPFQQFAHDEHADGEADDHSPLRGAKGGELEERLHGGDEHHEERQRGDQRNGKP